MNILCKNVVWCWKGQHEVDCAKRNFLFVWISYKIYYWTGNKHQISQKRDKWIESQGMAINF